MEYKILNEIKPKPVEWLWKGHLPLGELILSDGDPATNKSSVMLDLGARVSTGRAMPDGSEGVLGGVLLLQAEDSLRKTVVPRLQAAGADLSRIAQLPETVTIPADLKDIEEAVIGMEAKLLVIDPLSVFLGRNANNDQSVRQALAPLAEMADRTKIAVNSVRHLNKSAGQRSQYRGLGSIGIIAAARSRFLFGISPKDRNMRVMVHTKSNLGILTPSLLYEPVGNENGVVAIQWHGECDYTAEDLLAATKRGQREREDAKRFLKELLTDGPVAQKEVRDKAAQIGLAWRTIERAKADLKVISERHGFGQGGTVYWKLPPEDDHTPPANEVAVNGGSAIHTPPVQVLAVYGLASGQREEWRACAEADLGQDIIEADWVATTETNSPSSPGAGSTPTETTATTLSTPVVPDAEEQGTTPATATAPDDKQPLALVPNQTKTDRKRGFEIGKCVNEGKKDRLGKIVGFGKRVLNVEMPTVACCPRFRLATSSLPIFAVWRCGGLLPRPVLPRLFSVPTRDCTTIIQNSI